MIKNYFKSYAYLFGMIIILTIIFSIFNYFIVFPTKILKLLIPIISMLMASVILGKNTKNKAFLEGIKFSILYVLLSIIMAVIFKNGFTMKLILSYLLMIFAGFIGSMIGINLNREK